jgi:hypothetical protein
VLHRLLLVCMMDDFILFVYSSAEAVHTYVKDVVNISRFHQLLRNIPSTLSK